MTFQTGMLFTRRNWDVKKPQNVPSTIGMAGTCLQPCSRLRKLFTLWTVGQSCLFRLLAIRYQAFANSHHALSNIDLEVKKKRIMFFLSVFIQYFSLWCVYIGLSKSYRLSLKQRRTKLNERKVLVQVSQIVLVLLCPSSPFHQNVFIIPGAFFPQPVAAGEGADNQCFLFCGTSDRNEAHSKGCLLWPWFGYKDIHWQHHGAEQQLLLHGSPEPQLKTVGYFSPHLPPTQLIKDLMSICT